MWNVKKRMKLIVSVMLIACMSVSVVSAAQFGVSTHMGLGYDYANSSNVESAAATHVAWVRDECRWNLMQTTAGGALNIRIKDREYIRMLDRANINQLLVLAYGNQAYAAADTVLPKPSDATYYQAWLDYVRYTVTQVKDYVDAYEVWNEPDNGSFNYNNLGTASDYAQLYLDTKAIIDELDPTATVVCGSIAFTGSNSGYDYARGIFSYIQSQGSVNSLIDAFAIHAYPQYASRVEDTSYFPNWLNSWEGVFDQYGYTGDVWLTETSIPLLSGRATEAEQAYSVVKIGALWENYLKTNNRSGEIIWYDLRNDGTDASEYEHNLGIFNYDYTPKQAHYAMKAYNDLTGGKTFISKTDYKSKSSIVQYNGTNETVYLLWDTNNSGTARSVPVSGDVAYVYDYQGNITRTINNPSGTTSVNVYSAPVYVRSVTYRSSIDSVSYDNNNSVVEVSGNYNGGDTVTIQVLQGDNVVQSATATVRDGSYSKWFSFMGSGSYTVRVGYPEMTAAGKTSGWATETLNISAASQTAPEFSANTQVAYDDSTNTVTISGSVNNYVENQQVTILAIPSTMDLEEIDLSAAAYVKQIPATNGTFTAEFTVPDYFTTTMAIYLSGTGIGTPSSDYAWIEEGEYAHVADLNLSKGSSLTVSATLRNYTETAKTVTMMVVQYKGTQLVAINRQEVEIPAQTYATIQRTLSGVEIEANATAAKAFVWDDLTDMVPLVELEEISLNSSDE